MVVMIRRASYFLINLQSVMIQSKNNHGKTLESLMQAWSVKLEVYVKTNKVK